MGWVWVIFALISVLANLLEKMGKELQAPQPSAPDRKGRVGTDEDRAPVETFPRTPTEVSPRHKPKPAPIPVGDLAPAQLPDYPNQHEDLLTAEEKDILLRPQLEFEAEDPLLLTWCEEDLITEKDTLEEVREDEGSAFRSAFILAQVLARPDFTTVPWRRRI